LFLQAWRKTTLAYPLFHPRSRRQPPFTISRVDFAHEFPSEDDHVEFKSGAGEQPVQDTAVALSNHQGGVILVGVADDGSIRGRPLDAGTADAVHRALSNAHNVGRYDLYSVDVDGIGLTIVSVARREEGFAQTSSGRVLVRRGTRDTSLFGAELQRFINERSVTRFETTLTDVPLASVDHALYAPVASAHDWRSQPPSEERLEEIGFVRDGRLTVAGVLYLVEDPAALLGKTYVEVIRYQDDEASDYDRRDELRGPVDRQLRESVDLVAKELGTEMVVLGLRRYELPRIPAVVLRESVANALAHRSYEASGTPVRIEIRPGSVRVRSPGSLPEPVTVRNIRETNAARNIDVIRVLRRFGLAEDVGRGVDVMQDTMRSEMLDPPEFIDHGHSVEVLLRITSAVAPAERAWIHDLESRGDLEGPDRIVLVHGARGEPLTNSSVRELLHVDAQAARGILQRLRDRGFLNQHGQRGGATYTLASSLSPPAGLRLSPSELADLVVQLAADGPITNTDVRRATGLDRVASLAILDKLVSEGRLVRVGQRRGTRYHRPG
jgi:ATP-dependent DNA helicase RecG